MHDINQVIDTIPRTESDGAIEIRDESWTDEIEEILERVRINSVHLSEYHRRRYYHFKGYGKYFRIPLIVLASINSTASVGLQPVLEQPLISGITCIIGMVMGILGAIELYLGIQSSMDLELKQSKEFYTLAIEIYKTLALRRDSRGEDGRDYLNMKYSTYVKLCEASNLLRSQFNQDQLVAINNGDLQRKDYQPYQPVLIDATPDQNKYPHKHLPTRRRSSVMIDPKTIDNTLNTQTYININDINHTIDNIENTIDRKLQDVLDETTTYDEETGKSKLTSNDSDVSTPDKKV